VTISPRPCAAAVDLDVHVWVANRGTGTVVKIFNEGGLDSNANGVIDTCRNLPDCKRDPCEVYGLVYTPAKALPWWEDERVILNIEVGDMDSEPLVLAIDAYNNVWVDLYNEKRYVVLDGRTGEIPHSVEVRGHRYRWSALVKRRGDYDHRHEDGGDSGPLQSRGLRHSGRSHV